MSEEYKPVNIETHPDYNREPGISLVPGSNYLKEVAQFEQFPSKFTIGTAGPGNPYVYRPFPKMLYRAEHYNGKAVCMAAPPDPLEFADPREYERADERARSFTRKCQRIVQDEAEMHRAMEDGWRESAAEAVERLEARDRTISDETAHRNYTDRNMSEGAKREIEAQIAEAGGEHQPEIKRKPIRRRRKIA